MSRVRVAVVGLGYWGPNLARNFRELPQLIAEADTSRSVVMGRCRYLLVEPDQPRWGETGRYW